MLNDLASEAEALAAHLSAAGNADAAAELRRLAGALGDRTFRIVVFGEFNQGKSTLLNALLGHDALPMSVVPTTALLTEIRYGDEPSVSATVGGEEQQFPSLEALEALAELATLDEARRARTDVEAVRLAYPVALCQNDVVLYDTPGLNDRAEQDKAATRALELADLVLFVVDLRRLGTLNERTVLEQWLQGRGMDAVVVAANFVNLLPPGDYGDARARLAAFAARWGCPYLPENCFEVDALGGLRARLADDERAWEWSGMGRLAAALERSASENRQLLHRRSRLGRLRAWLRAMLPGLRADLAAAEERLKEATTRELRGRRELERALGHVERARQDSHEAFLRVRADLHGALATAGSLPREQVGDLNELCAAPVKAFLETVEREWGAALRRALADLPPGAPVELKVRTRWPFDLPQAVFEPEPAAGTPPGLPRDREEALARAQELAQRGREAAGQAAAQLHRGIGSVLERAADRPPAESVPGRLLRQARGAWSNLPPTEPGTNAAADSTHLSEESRRAIERAVEQELDEVDAYLARLGDRIGQSLTRRAERGGTAVDPALREEVAARRLSIDGAERLASRVQTRLSG